MNVLSVPLLEGVMYLDTSYRYVKINESAERLTGFKSEEVEGRYCHEDLLNPVDLDGHMLCLEPTELGDDELYRERDIFLHHKNGHRVLVTSRLTRWMEGETHIGYIEMFLKKHVQLPVDPYPDDFEDPVTKLCNMSYAKTFLGLQIELERIVGIPFGIIIMDIDNFEGHNLTYGRALGDEMLRVVSQSLKEVFYEASLIARLEGDEFMLVFSNISSNRLKDMGEKLRIVMENTSLRGQAFKEVDMTVSIGGTLIRPRDTTTVILDRAMDFLRKSKSRGGNRAAIV